MTRRRVIAGNWKMFKTQAETRAFFSAFRPLVSSAKHCDIVVVPAFTAIPAAVEAAKNTNIAISAQDVHWEKEGAFTGEISTNMLVEAGCRYVIIGHSERRQFFGETDESVAKKTKAALAAGRANMGHWDGPHGYAGNGRRCSPLSSQLRGGEILSRPGFRFAHSLRWQREAGQYSRTDGAGRTGRCVGGRSESRRKIICDHRRSFPVAGRKLA